MIGFGRTVAPHQDDRRSAITLIEILAILAVVGLLAAIFLPAIQTARQAARRAGCTSNLRQLVLGVNAYQARHRMYPMGATCKGYSFLSTILPDIDQASLFNSINFDAAVFGGEYSDNRTAAMTQLAVFLCPLDFGSKSEAGLAWNNYAGSVGFVIPPSLKTRGFFNSPYEGCVAECVMPASVTDGLGQTAALSEWLLPDFVARDPLRAVFHTAAIETPNADSFAALCHGSEVLSMPIVTMVKGTLWLRRGPGLVLYNHLLAPDDHSCVQANFDTAAWTATSLHPGGVNVAFADGRVQFERATINLRLWRALGTRSGHEIAHEWWQ